MARRESRLVKHDDERERTAFLRIVERLAYIAIGIYLGYMMGLMAP